MLESYVEARNCLLESLEDLHQLISHRKDESAAKATQELIAKLLDGHFNLAVLGQFKRGKTTLINALLGSRLLPTAVVPLTSIITMIKYGNNLKIEVLFKNGVRKEITLEQLPDYVTERGNPENQKGVQYAEVHYDSPYLRDGVQIIDTPGIGSTYEHNTDVTYNYLSKVDAAVFLVGVDPPISQVEYNFLNDIRKHVNKIFFLQNKIDQMDEKDRAESLEFTKGVIEEKASLKDIKIFPISAKVALEARLNNNQEKMDGSLISDVEKALNDFLMKEKGKAVLSSALNNTLKILSDEMMSIELEMKAISIPLEELKKKINEFNIQKEKISQAKQDFEYLLRGEKEKLISILESDLKNFVEAKVPELTKKMEEHYKNHKDKGKTELTKAIDRAMRREVESIFNEWRTHEEDKLRQGFENVSRRFSSKANDIIAYIKKLSSDIFDIKVETLSSVETLAEETYFQYRIGSLFDTTLALEILPFALPGFLFRRMALKRMLEQCREELDKNAGRIRYDFLERIEKSLGNFRDELFSKINATLTGIESALERAILEIGSGEEKVTYAKKNIKEQTDVLKRIRGSLGKLERELSK
ncbi:MAG: dynamin family protein [Deltaproteobacteria bacterium]|nr:dynamin family protein [Deltaproteobacteria bacterium]